MIIKYLREREYQGEGNDPSLTLGNTYTVLGLIFHTDNYPNQVCIRRDSDAAPVLFDIKYFDFVDERIPDSWVIQQTSIGYDITPHEFLGDFWDLYHDGYEEAETIFETTTNLIELFHSN